MFLHKVTFWGSRKHMNFEGTLSKLVHFPILSSSCKPLVARSFKNPIQVRTAETNPKDLRNSREEIWLASVTRIHPQTPVCGCIWLNNLGWSVSFPNLSEATKSTRYEEASTELSGIFAVFFLSFFFFSCNTGVWTQGLQLARNIHYHLNYTSILVALIIFHIVSHIFCLELASDHDPPTSASHTAGIADVTQHACPQPGHF